MPPVRSDILVYPPQVTGLGPVMRWDQATNQACVVMASSRQSTRLTADYLVGFSSAVIADGYVDLSPDGTIAGLGSLADLTAKPEVHAPLAPSHATLLVPGWINAHAHLELTFAPPQAPIPHNPACQPFSDWLLVVVALTRQATGQADHAATRLARIQKGARQMWASGVREIHDISSDGASLPVLDALGLGGSVSLEFFHPAQTLNLGYLESVAQQFDTLRAAYADHPRLQVGLSPHSPYNVSPQAWRWMLDRCQPDLVHTHLAECQAEVDYVTGRDTRTIDTLHQAVLGATFAPPRCPDGAVPTGPVDLLDQWGLLECRLLAAHCVALDAPARQRLGAAGVKIAHCPASNLYLHGITWDWSAWRTHPGWVGVGSDSVLGLPPAP
jgi:5-methylthioadenosine/S-adenosylhomocysteine deaminase